MTGQPTDQPTPLTPEKLIDVLNDRIESAKRVIVEKDQEIFNLTEQLRVEHKQKSAVEALLRTNEQKLQRAEDLLSMSQNKLQRALGYIDRVNETAGGHKITEHAGDMSRIQISGAMFGPRIEDIM
jgi:chromosome segregation ATPase